MDIRTSIPILRKAIFKLIIKIKEYIFYMKLIICCYNMCDYNSVNKYFDDFLSAYDGITIEVVRSDIISCDAEVIASAGNSFGMMDGGIDKIINYNLNFISSNVQEILRERYFGECPVGDCILVKTDHQKFKYLCYAPTMRVPENVSTTINAYLALKSVLIKCLNHKVKSVVVPLFCGGAGEMPVNKICHQYRMALESLYFNFNNWKSINEFHRNLIFEK